MNLAQQALKLNNLGQAHRLLDRHRPQPREEDLRGWEWRYLWQLTRLDSGRESILWRAPDQGRWDVRDVAFSQDGSRLVIYAAASTPELGDAVWVVNVSSAQIESRHPGRFFWRL